MWSRHCLRCCAGTEVPWPRHPPSLGPPLQQAAGPVPSLNLVFALPWRGQLFFPSRPGMWPPLPHLLGACCHFEATTVISCWGGWAASPALRLHSYPPADHFPYSSRWSSKRMFENFFETVANLAKITDDTAEKSPIWEWVVFVIPRHPEYFIVYAPTNGSSP